MFEVEHLSSITQRAVLESPSSKKKSVSGVSIEGLAKTKT